MAKHKHYDLIMAWAAGATIQYRSGPNHDWTTVDGPGGDRQPGWDEDCEYRVQPERVRRYFGTYKGGVSSATYTTPAGFPADVISVVCIELDPDTMQFLQAYTI